jgi:ferredoxin
MPKVTIQVQGRREEMEVAEGTHLLLEAAARGLSIPFRCTTGRCGTCRVQVQSGMEHLSDYTELELFRLKDAHLAVGCRLACQTFVYGDVTVQVPEEGKEA